MGRLFMATSAAISIAALVAVTGCSQKATATNMRSRSAATATTSPSVRQARIRPSKDYRIDESTGQIVLPLDKYAFDYKQLQILDFATQVLDHRCLAHIGVDLPVVDRRNEAPAVSRRYGVWLEGTAKTFGYKTEPPASGAAKRIRVMQSITDPRQLEEIQRCRQSKEYKGITEQTANLGLTMVESYNTALQSPAGSHVILAWRSCLTSNGVRVDKNPDSLWLPMGLPLRDDAAAQKIALTDVACKRRVNLVSTLASLEAGVQNAVIQANRRELDTKAQNLRRALDHANVIIGAYR